MALTAAQEVKLLRILRERFSTDDIDTFELRLLRFVVRNNPSVQQKTIIQAVIDDVVASRNTAITAVDTDAVTTKTNLQNDRDTIAAIGTNL